MPARAGCRAAAPRGRRVESTPMAEATTSQGTVKDYEVSTRAGSVVTDDGTEIAIEAASVEGADLRFLRQGQRVIFEVKQEGGRAVARSLRIVTL